MGIPTQVLQTPGILIPKEDQVDAFGESYQLSEFTSQDETKHDGDSGNYSQTSSESSKPVEKPVARPLKSTENIPAGSSKTVNSSSSPMDPKLSPGLYKAIHEKTLKFPEGRPEPTFCHCVIDGCGYRSYGEIAQKYHAKEVHNLPKPQFVQKLLNDTVVNGQ